MGMGIYKPGQGYWVRVLTAVFAGVLLLAAAAWLWAQVGLIPLPAKAWVYSASGLTGSPQPGQTVRLLGTRGDDDRIVELGTASVDSFLGSGATAGRLRLSRFQLSGGALPDEATRIQIDDAPAALAQPQPVPVIEPIFVQASAVAVLFLIGAVLIYLFVGTKKSTVDFLIASDGEMKKVNWSTRREILGSTWVVLALSLILIVALFFIDLGFSKFFRSIGVLE